MLLWSICQTLEQWDSLLCSSRELHRSRPGRFGWPPQRLVPAASRERKAEQLWKAWSCIRFKKLFYSSIKCRNRLTELRTEVQFSLTVLEKSLVASCKDSIGWMFSKLDTNGDLYLDQAELAAINLDKYEVCIRLFFSSCDSYKDGKVSTAEWCLCFWRESEWIYFVTIKRKMTWVENRMGDYWLSSKQKSHDCLNLKKTKPFLIFFIEKVNNWFILGPQKLFLGALWLNHKASIRCAFSAGTSRDIMEWFEGAV